MTETERQFREAGWKRGAECMYRWDHPKYPTLFLDPDIREQLMDMWLTGFVSGKEWVSPPGETDISSETEAKEAADGNS